MKYYTLSNILIRLLNNKPIIIIILNLLSFNNCHNGLQSPCPNVLSYQKDNFGIITVNNYLSNNVNSITVRTTSNNHFANPNLELTQNQNNIFKAVDRKSPIYFRLKTEDGSVPNVLDIVSNGATICSSKESRLNSIFTITHRLTLQSNVGNPLPKFIPPPANNKLSESLKNNIFLKPILNGMPKSQFSQPQNTGVRYSVYQGRDFTSNLNPFLYNLFQRQFTKEISPVLEEASTPSNINPFYIESPQSTKPNQNPLFSESPSICGTTTLRAPLILNGQIFQPGSWPWLTILFRKSTKTFDCGGSLISHTSVVTAAHCFPNGANQGDYIMGIGVYDIKQRREDGAIFENIKNIRIHPEYNSALHEPASYADIAIVTLQGFIEYNRRIKPICLWNMATDFDRIANKIGIVAGWGLTDPKGSPSSDIPTYVTAKIVSYADCIISNPAFGQIASNTTLCAGFRNGTGPCRGDSGNGLMVEESGKWYLTGIVSQALFHQTNECKLDDYVVYTNALNVIEWIQRFMTE